MSKCTRLILAAALVFASLPASAPTITGTITGIVKDASGGVLPGATVTMTQLETNRQETAVSDAEGRYASGPLPLGTYRLEASLTGFKSAMRSGVTLTIDDWRGSTSRSKSAPCRKCGGCIMLLTGPTS